MLIGSTTLEDIFTIGILISFIGLIVGMLFERKNIAATLKAAGFRRRDLLIAAIIVIAFIAIELYLVKPTQLLFFDDAIYQSMALDLLRTGQAWMCNYGTPAMCYQGQVFHEPIGLSFNLAIAYLIFGVSRSTSHGAQLALAAFCVFMTYMVSMLLLKNRKAAIFGALIFAMTPIILVWAMPTGSDMATLAYSLISIFVLLLFIKKKTALALLNLLLSIALLMYMKVDALIYIPAFAVMFIIMDENTLMKSIKDTLKLIKNNVLNTKVLLAILLFVLILTPSLIYAFSNYSTDGFGYQGSNVPLTCSSNGNYIVAQGSINYQNFKANICANTAFWFNQFRSQYIIQPFYFTLLALVGIMLMLLLSRKRQLGFLALWFVPLFMLYTAFYAGGVTFGVDWRFMISLMAVPAILGGYTLATINDYGTLGISKLTKHKKSNAIKIASYAIAAILILTLFYALYMEAPLLSINPSQIQQAGDARFYENFVYANANAIPSTCIVYTYDPTLFNLVNKTAVQLSNIYNTSFYANASSRYSCSIVDIGYWCYTPDNLCTPLNSSFTLKPIANATYNLTGHTYSLDLVQQK